MKKYARRTQLGENFELDHVTLKFDSVFYNSSRGWFTLGHTLFVLLFFFKHIWHGAKTLIQDVFAGIDPDTFLLNQVINWDIYDQYPLGLVLFPSKGIFTSRSLSQDWVPTRKNTFPTPRVRRSHFNIEDIILFTILGL